MPILRILRATSMPLTSLPFSRMRTITRLLFLCDEPSPVFTSMHIQSACKLLVIHIFWPLMM